MAEIQKKQRSYSKLNTRVLVLSCDSPEQSENIKNKMGLSFTILCDENRKVVDLFNLRNPFEHGGIAYPATFIINTNKKICYRSIDGTAKRLDLTDEILFLEQLHRNAGHTMDKKSKKAWILPTVRDNWRMSLNMIALGSFADWKHFFLLPLTYLRILVHRIKT